MQFHSLKNSLCHLLGDVSLYWPRTTLMKLCGPNRVVPVETFHMINENSDLLSAGEENQIKDVSAKSHGE